MRPSDPPNPSSALRERTACISVVVVALLLNVCFSGLSVIDDAYITFRHATNLVQHGELVFNVGERVEGITDMLWALLLAGCNRVLGTRMVETSVVLSLLLLPWALLRVYQVVLTITGKHPWGAAAALLLALNPHFLLATTNGLEAGLFAAMLGELCFRVMLGQFTASGLLIGVMFLTRPDAAALIVATGVAIRLSTGGWKPLWSTLIGAGGFVVAATAFRLSYYGHWIPNSIVAKSFPLSSAPQLLLAGIKYTASFAAMNGYLVLPFALLFLRFDRVRSLSGPARTMLAFGLTSLAISWAVAMRNGGDWMPHYRLFLQYGPLWAIVGAAAMELASMDLRRVAVLGLWPLGLMAVAAVHNRGRLFTLDTTSGDFYEENTRRLAGKLLPNDVVSAEAIGYISYHLLGTRFHDPLGLNDLYIARHGSPAIRFGKENPNYTFGVIAPAVAIWQTGSHLWHVRKNLLSGYEVRRFGPDAGWQSNVVCIRKDRAADLSRAFADWPVVEGGPPLSAN